MSAQGIGRDKALTVLYRSPLPIGFQPLPCGWLLRPSISSAAQAYPFGCYRAA